MHAHELAEQVAALVLLGVALYVLPASWLARRKAGARPSAEEQLVARVDSTTVGSALRLLTATLAMGAAAIQFALTPAHLEHSLPHGLALGAVAVVHIAIGGLARAGHLDRARRPALVVTAGIVGTWILSRTVGLPIGATAWDPGQVGLAEATAITFEVGLIAVLYLATPARLHRTFGGRVREMTSVAIIPAVGILSTVALLVAASASAGSSGGHQHSAVPAPHHAAASMPEVFPTD